MKYHFQPKTILTGEGEGGGGVTRGCEGGEGGVVSSAQHVELHFSIHAMYRVSDSRNSVGALAAGCQWL